MKIYMAISAIAAALSLSGATTLSGWDTDFVAATNASIRAHKPLVLFWANTGCSHCEALEEDVQGEAFTAWQEASPYVFCFVLGKNGNDPGGGTAAKDFAGYAGGTAKKMPSHYPLLCLYWPKADGSVTASSFTTDSAATLKANAERLFSGYVPMPEYIGGDLAFTAGYENARLEAEAGFTTYVDVPLERDGAAAPFAATNTVVATLGGAEIKRESVVWVEGEGEREVRIAIPSGAAAGDKIAVSLYEDDATLRGSVDIHVVGARENSTKNPLFIGERTAQTLGYGEWTMDMDVAMEKFRAEEGSRLMAVSSGSLWCPDCVMTDEHLLENAAFKAWAVENKVILVDIDVPNFPNTTNSACLLTRVVGRTSDGYISGRGTLATNELERYQSGAGYLSRHMVSLDAAAAVLERNRSLVGRNTLEGGWNNPERANQNRTGIPNFFALNRAGELVGTFETFDAIGPSEFREAYLARFTELTDLCAGGNDGLLNRSWQTTKAVFAGEGAEAAGTLSAIDLVDTYLLAAPDEAAAEQTVTVRGGDTNTVVTVSIIAVVRGSAKTLATATGALSGGVSVTGVISSAGSYYVRVAGADAGTLAADSAAQSTTAAYSLGGSRRAVENPFTNDWTGRAATTTLPLYAADGVTLRGTLALTLKKNGKLSAKYSNGRKTLATFSGKWDADIAADGTATAEMSKKGYSLSLVITADGVVEAEVSDGAATLSSGECGLAESYGDFAGVYTVAMPATSDEATTEPAGAAVMTLKMATTKSAKTRGLFRYTVYLPDGKRLSGTSNVTWLDANFGIVPVLKASGTNAFSATLKIRRGAGTAASARAIVALDGTSAVWTGASAGTVFTRTFDVFGSVYDKGASMLTGIGDDVLTLEFTPETWTVAESPAYGALLGVAGDGTQITVTDAKATAEKTKNFTFRVTKASGLVSGTSRLSFEGKERVSAKYTGVLLRGWFSDCDCGEDGDTTIEMQNVAFATGFCLFSDKINKKTAKRSFTIKVK